MAWIGGSPPGSSVRDTVLGPCCLKTRGRAWSGSSLPEPVCWMSLGVPGGHPGPLGSAGTHVHSGPRFLGTCCQSLELGKPLGAFRGKAGEAGSRGMRMLLGQLEGQVWCIGPGFLQGHRRWPWSGSTVIECPLRPHLTQGIPELQAGVRDYAPSFPTFSVFLFFTQMAESLPWNTWLL